jgi:hypothetical protein
MLYSKTDWPTDRLPSVVTRDSDSDEKRTETGFVRSSSEIQIKARRSHKAEVKLLCGVVTATYRVLSLLVVNEVL